MMDVTEDDDRHPPGSLFRFRPLHEPAHRDWLRQIVVDEEVFCPPAAWMNDPFELRPRLVPMDETQARAYLIAARNRQGAGLSEAEWGAKCGYVLPRLVNGEFGREQIDKQAHEHGLLCMNEQRDSILMWSLYASGHRGYCIELRQTLADWKLGRVPFHIRYTDHRPTLALHDVLNNDPSRARDTAIAMFSTKARYWEYEAEWRMVAKPKQKVRLAPGALLSITMGAIVTPEDRSLVARLISVHRPEAALFQARLDHDEYRLHFDRLDAHAVARGER